MRAVAGDGPAPSGDRLSATSSVQRSIPHAASSRSWTRTCSTTASTSKLWWGCARPAVTSANRRKCGAYPGRGGTGCIRNTRQAEQSRIVGPPACLRDAHASARAVVGSASTSVPRVVVRTWSWLTGPSTAFVPSGATGASSTASKSAAASKARPSRRWSTRRRRSPPGRRSGPGGAGRRARRVRGGRRATGPRGAARTAGRRAPARRRDRRARAHPRHDRSGAVAGPPLHLDGAVGDGRRGSGRRPRGTGVNPPPARG